MYSTEINETLRRNNYTIDSETYSNICQTSPQINHAKYNAHEQCYEIWTDDGNYWKFTVHRKE